MYKGNRRSLGAVAILLLALSTQPAHAAQGTGSVGAHAPRTPSPRWARLGGSFALLAGGAPVADACATLLVPETSIGSWEVIGNTLPENLDATGIGVLRPDGTIFYCHDATDPIVFDPVSALQTEVCPPSDLACLQMRRGRRPASSSISASRHGPTRAGIPRRLELATAQSASTAQVTLPTDPNVLPLGWYMLFGMVDGIPSEALLVRIDP